MSVVKNMPALVGLSSAGRRVGRNAAHVALQSAVLRTPAKSPVLSHISESSSKSSKASLKSEIKGGANGGVDAKDITPEKIKELVTRTMSNRYAVAGIVFVVTAVLLILINPPMAQVSSTETTPSSRSLQKIFVWSSLAATSTLILPLGIQFIKSRKSSR